MMTRRATAKDVELQLKNALQDLKAAKDLSDSLITEREESETEIYKNITRITELKNELADLHVKYSDVVQKCNQMQDFIESFRACSDTHEQALSRITDLEISLSLAQKTVLDLEKENKSIIEDKHSQSLFNELLQCNSVANDNSTSECINYVDKPLFNNNNNICQFSSGKKLKKYIKINRYIRKTQKLIKKQNYYNKYSHIKKERKQLLEQLNVINMETCNKNKESELLVLSTSDMSGSITSRRSTDARDDASDNAPPTDSDNNILSSSDPSEERLSLASFLIERACGNSVVGNYLYWYLLVECEDAPAHDARHMYLRVMRTYSQRLAHGNADLQRTRSFLARQQVFIDKLVKLVKTVTRESGNRNKKAERLQQLLADPDAFKFNFTNFEPMPFPLDPNVTIKGIVAKKASLFKSALMPSKLTFLTTEGMEYEAIFKHGDDLRQDQLILQMITLMDKLLRRENLDLKLTPYKVLATSSKHGFLQFIESVTVAEALATEGSIQNFFRKHNPCEGAPYGIKPETMDTYIRSCAGYCVITYLLGVGDRHLDNLLLTKAGALFHIDFGYILGRDPKPLPPPMKLSKEMVEAMGGVHSEHYHEFRKQCYTAFLHLRRHANLMLNLFSLMVDASVPDIALEPDKAVKKVQDKLRLDLGDEEAVHYLQNLLDMSVTAVMAALVEHFHKFAQYWRK